MAWREPDLQIEILCEFARLSPDGWDVPDLGSPYDQSDPELTSLQRARQRREGFLARMSRAMPRKKKAAAR